MPVNSVGTFHSVTYGATSCTPNFDIVPSNMRIHVWKMRCDKSCVEFKLKLVEYLTTLNIGVYMYIHHDDAIKDYMHV